MEEKSRIIKKLNNDSTRPIVFNESSGGSESQLRLLLKYLPDESFKNINLILNNTDYDLLEKERINVLWMQHFVNQKEAQNLGSKDYTDKIDYIVFNSNWNFEKFVYQFKIPETKSLVIKNAIEKIEFHEKPKDKINLIYHTTPWRGLANLLNVFKNLNFKNNVELNVCSSTKIYGKSFDGVYAKQYTNLFNGERFLIKELIVNPKSSISLQKHKYRSEHWTITSGKPKITINNKKFFKNVNDSVFIHQGAIHRIENPFNKSVKIMEVQTGAILKESDIIRYKDIYGRIN